jgi:hypothetical protein
MVLIVLDIPQPKSYYPFVFALSIYMVGFAEDEGDFGTI